MNLPRALTLHTVLAAICLGSWQCASPGQKGPSADQESGSTPETAGARRLTDSSADQLAPAFSADGTRLIFQSNTDGNWELYTLSLADGRSQRLTDTPELEEDPSWSPDGKLVICTTHAPTLDQDAPRDILVMDADGRNRHLLAAHGADDFCPRFSVDGASVFFISDRVDTRKDVSEDARQTAVFRYVLAEDRLEQLTEAATWSQPLPTATGLALRADNHSLVWLQGTDFQAAIADSGMILGQADYLASQGWIVSQLSEEADGRLRWRPNGSTSWKDWPLEGRDAEWTPAFAPDGSQLVFAGRDRGQWDLYLRTLPAPAPELPVK